MIQFACPGCAQRLRGNTLLAGKTIKCPKCARSVVVPAESTAPVAAGNAAAKRDLPDEKTRAPQAAAGPDVAESATVPPADTRTTAPAPKEDTNPANNPGATQEINAEDDRSLTDFLAPPQQPDEIGRLGEYRVLKVLGAGGMGVVFKAEDPGLQRLVAIKAMLPAIAASAAAKKRFLREARAAAAIKHNHIVTIFQVGEDRGIPFLAMEFLEGEPLDDRLKRESTLPLTEVLRIGREMAEGMAAAHERGLIHRDIKPANTWLEASPGRKASPGRESGEFHVKILDFGLARSETDQAHLTQSGAIIGTPAYMSPEQGRGGKLDARSDLWSLGVMLYRMCTGELPFKGQDTVSTLMSVAMDNPRPPVKINAAVPAGLSKLIMKLLEKDPARRIASAHEVAEELRSLEQSRQATQTVAAPSTQSARRKLPSAGQTLTFVGRQLTFVGRTLLSAGMTIGKKAVVVPLAKALKRAGSVSARSVRKRSKNRKLVLLAVALLLLAGGYGLFQIVRIRDKEGNEITRAKVPEGGSGQIVPDNKARDPDPPMPPADPVREALVKKSVDAGVAFLRKQVQPVIDTKTLGEAALVGLTLLECGVPPDDADVQKLVKAVREGGRAVTQTYGVSLSILFLDRLHKGKNPDAEDRNRIRTLALRLIKGQLAGTENLWGYPVPVLTGIQEEILVKELHEKKEIIAAVGNRGDTSNSQFAALALWVARRYDVPVTSALRGAANTMRKHQNPAGTWAYVPGVVAKAAGEWHDTGTCVGLILLALDRAVSDAREPDDFQKDPAVAKAVEHLAKVIQKNVDQQAPKGAKRNPFKASAYGDYYFLWSLERTALILNLNTIGGQDWHTWGSDIFLDYQQPDGSWKDALPPTPDTCFALLFLTRSNLFPDLSERLRPRRNS